MAILPRVKLARRVIAVVEALQQHTRLWVCSSCLLLRLPLIAALARSCRAQDGEGVGTEDVFLFFLHNSLTIFVCLSASLALSFPLPPSLGLLCRCLCLWPHQHKLLSKHPDLPSSAFIPPPWLLTGWKLLYSINIYFQSTEDFGRLHSSSFDGSLRITCNITLYSLLQKNRLLYILYSMIYWLCGTSDRIQDRKISATKHSIILCLFIICIDIGFTCVVIVIIAVFAVLVPLNFSILICEFTSSIVILTLPSTFIWLPSQSPSSLSLASLPI